MSVPAGGGGSSPRRRGTRSTGAVRRGEPRFIPAQAGNTAMPPIAASVRSVHPRAGGEHGALMAYATLDDGSSPRRRGTLFA
ncbi:Hypothetical protein GbCGDNIH2_7188 [Granulibacter bethesdensis]|nr:Hypothetical protein GbCGDNIH2_7188 [Granulibacter bethesdensis]